MILQTSRRGLARRCCPATRPVFTCFPVGVFSVEVSCSALYISTAAFVACVFIHKGPAFFLKSPMCTDGESMENSRHPSSGGLLRGTNGKSLLLSNSRRRQHNFFKQRNSCRASDAHGFIFRLLRCDRRHPRPPLCHEELLLGGTSERSTT